jgi:hypothetical protein
VPVNAILGMQGGSDNEVKWSGESEVGAISVLKGAHTTCGESTESMSMPTRSIKWE